MKIIHRSLSCLVCIFAITALCAAQRQQPTPTPQESQTKIETFQAKRGAVIVKNYTTIGTLTGTGGAAEVTSYEFVDAQTGRKQYGIGVEVKQNTRLEREERSFIDYDEIDSLLQGIDYISKIDPTITKLKNFEAQYKTVGDFSITTFNDSSGEISVAISSGRIGKVSVYLKLTRLAEFRKLIADAKAALDAVKA